MRIAIIGQSMFGADVYRLLQKDGHHIVGVFTVPDVNGKPDPLGKEEIIINKHWVLLVDMYRFSLVVSTRLIFSLETVLRKGESNRVEMTNDNLFIAVYCYFTYDNIVNYFDNMSALSF